MTVKKLPDNQIEELARQKLSGESYTQIRSRLAQEGLSEEDIKSSIREVDEIVLRLEMEQGAKQKAKSLYWTGLVLTIAALLLTVAFNAGWILNSAPRWAIYFPFFLGILIMYYGKSQQKKKPDPFHRDPDRIRKKRPYK